MHRHSDIIRLFSKFAIDTKQYQEIASRHGQKKSGSDWALLDEIQHAPETGADRQLPLQKNFRNK